MTDAEQKEIEAIARLLTPYQRSELLEGDAGNWAYELGLMYVQHEFSYYTPIGERVLAIIESEL